MFFIGETKPWECPAIDAAWKAAVEWFSGPAPSVNLGFMTPNEARRLLA